MASLNKCQLIGLVGKDPEIRSLGNGNEVANFSLATTDTWKDKQTGEKKERTEWHRITVFQSGLVGIIKNYVKKGSKLYIEGSLQTREYVDKNTNGKKSVTEIVLQGYGCSLQLLDSKPSHGTQTAPKSNGREFVEEEMIDDDMPW